jgi:predicted branched-subunit amino acid permease
VSSFLYVAWVFSTFLGALFYRNILNPLEWGIDFALPATFLVLLIPRLADRIALLVCLVSALCSILGALFLPGKWYIIFAAVTATFAGGILERSSRNEP